MKMEFVDLYELAELEFADGDDKSQLGIAGSVNKNDGKLIIVTADLGVHYIPLDYFKTSGDGITPNFNKLKIVDWGHTIQFGDYEADLEYDIKSAQE